MYYKNIIEVNVNRLKGVICEGVSWIGKIWDIVLFVWWYIENFIDK